MQPFLGLGNSLQTAQTGGAVGGWVELARTTLGSAGDSITVSSLDDKRYYMVLTDLQDTGGSIHAEMRLNGDTGSNYHYRYNNNGGSDVTGQATIMALNPAVQASDVFSVGYLANLSSKEKLHINHCVNQYASGAATAPYRQESVNKHAQTSNPINSVTVRNGAGSGDYAIGSECVVLGWDPDDTHTTNFWEELASVELGSADTEIDSGTISAKKYLWCQAYLKPPGASRVGYIKFNNDTTSYSWRRSNNGGSDVTGTSDSAIRMDESRATNKFVNFFVINNSSNEKLVLGHSVTQNTAGAANAPERDEFIGKHDETGAQITSIQIRTNTGNWDTGTILKVWGSD